MTDDKRTLGRGNRPLNIISCLKKKRTRGWVNRDKCNKNGAEWARKRVKGDKDERAKYSFEFRFLVQFLL